MNEYHIEHQIRTLATLYEFVDDPFIHRDFAFNQWEQSIANGPSGRAWKATKTIHSKDVVEAINKFREDVLPIVDKIAFVSQCYSEAELGSFLIIKSNNNEDKIFYIRYTEERDGVPLRFGPNQVNSLKKLDRFIDRGHVFYYLKEAVNATTYYTTLAMLISALEAIAGEDFSIPGRISTKTDYIRDEILKDKDLFKKNYRYGTGIRVVLFHGKDLEVAVRDEKGEHYINQIYECIVNYFNEKHGLSINLNVVNPMRHPFGNYKTWSGWVKPKNSDQKIELHAIHRMVGAMLDGNPDDSAQKFHQEFDILLQNPAGY